MSDNNIEIETPTLAKVIDDAILGRLVDLNVSMPGKIVSVDDEKSLCDVQPLLKRVYKNGDVVDLPLIQNVPINWPRTANAVIKLPIATDDLVTLLFSQRSLDLWLESNGTKTTDTNDPRMHHISDAIAIPGLYPFGQTTQATEGKLILINDKGEIKISPDGKIEIGNGTDEVIEIISDFIAAVKAARTVTLIGNNPLFPQSSFTALKARIDKLKV